MEPNIDVSGTEAPKTPEGTITLSHLANVLIREYAKIRPKPMPDDVSKISVSQTVSFFALAYEKLRNAVEYRDASLIRRAAVQRILVRRLGMNPSGRGEAENLIRELLWARYFPNESLGTADVAHVQNIINTYLYVRAKLIVGHTGSKKSYLSQFLIHLMTCEIEETLQPDHAKRQSLNTFYIYQVLKNKVKITKVTEEDKNAAFYVALERAYNKSDTAYLRHHLFNLSYKPLSHYNKTQLDEMIANLGAIFSRIDSIIANPYSDRIRRFIKHHLPPFHIMFEVLSRRGSKSEEYLTDPKKLWADVQQYCREKYEHSQKRLRMLGVKAIVYLFITKMILALILEYPVSLLLFGEINYIALAINSLFPPFLMFLILAFTRVPNLRNTQRIYHRIVDIINQDQSFETTVSFTTKQTSTKRPILVFSFTIFYALTFILTFGLLVELMRLVHFNLISMGIFIFFLCVVTFFAYRIRQTSKEYSLAEKEDFFRPFADVFFVPILSVGKVLSNGLSRLNFFSVIFDFIIEAPFKLIIEVVEEWISFVRQKRDEIG